MVVRIDRLANGIVVATDSMPDLESAALGVWVRVGSRYEQEREHGISHFLEHMAFKGTKTRTARSIAEEIEAVGGEVNASTSVENTAYYARVLARDVPLAIDILADILQNSVFDGEEMRREKGVILQEIGAAFDTPDDLVFDKFLATAWPGQPVGRPILGSPETVKQFSRDDISSYLDRYYGASSLIFSASGRVVHEDEVRVGEDEFHETKRVSWPRTLAYDMPEVCCRHRGPIERRRVDDRTVPRQDVHVLALEIVGIALDRRQDVLLQHRRWNRPRRVEHEILQ